MNYTSDQLLSSCSILVSLCKLPSCKQHWALVLAFMLSLQQDHEEDWGCSAVTRQPSGVTCRQRSPQRSTACCQIICFKACLHSTKAATPYTFIGAQMRSFMLLLLSFNSPASVYVNFWARSLFMKTSGGRQNSLPPLKKQTQLTQ